MRYRSLSFHQGFPNEELVRLGARLGFNDITLQTEGGTLGPLQTLRERADKYGYFQLAHDLGMTVSIWVHELEDIDPNWGQISPDNEVLWAAIEQRYEFILQDLFPEMDNLVLTVVESQYNMASSASLGKLVRTLHSVCQRYGKRLMLRSFAWHPAELQNVVSTISTLPDDITIVTKNVPQDWHLRSINEPLIGQVHPKSQIIEVDIAGEYFRLDHLANCFTDILTQQFAYWSSHGCDGISVRVDRGWNPEQHQTTVLHQPQEVNLWLLGYLATGRTTSEDNIWKLYTGHYFGDAASIMETALRPTGQVVAEALCVERETFGDTRDCIPARQVMLGHLWDGNTRYEYNNRNSMRATAYSDKEDDLWRNPFHNHWSVFRWHPSYNEEYQHIRKGDSQVIARKQKAYQLALESATSSLNHLSQATGHFAVDEFNFFRFKLEENIYHLEVMCEMQLAWLKSERCLYTNNDNERMLLREQVQQHLNHLERLHDRTSETTMCSWQGVKYYLQRGSYVDISSWLSSFRNYFTI